MRLTIKGRKAITRAMRTAYRAGCDPYNSHAAAAVWFRRQAVRRPVVVDVRIICRNTLPI